MLLNKCNHRQFSPDQYRVHKQFIPGGEFSRSPWLSKIDIRAWHIKKILLAWFSKFCIFFYLLIWNRGQNFTLTYLSDWYFTCPRLSGSTCQVLDITKPQKCIIIQMTHFKWEMKWQPICLSASKQIHRKDTKALESFYERLTLYVLNSFEEMKFLTWSILNMAYNKFKS